MPQSRATQRWRERWRGKKTWDEWHRWSKARGMSAGLNKYLQCALLCVYGRVYDHTPPPLDHPSAFSSLASSSLPDYPILACSHAVQLFSYLLSLSPYLYLSFFLVYMSNLTQNNRGNKPEQDWGEEMLRNSNANRKMNAKTTVLQICAYMHVWICVAASDMQIYSKDMSKISVWVYVWECAQCSAKGLFRYHLCLSVWLLTVLHKHTLSHMSGVVFYV